MPYDITWENEEAQKLLGTLNGPWFGIRLRYTFEEKYEPTEGGGKLNFRKFVIEGEEAVWSKGFTRWIEILEAAGCQIETALCRDEENYADEDMYLIPTPEEVEENERRAKEYVDSIDMSKVEVIEVQPDGTHKRIA